VRVAVCVDSRQLASGWVRSRLGRGADAVRGVGVEVAVGVAVRCSGRAVASAVACWSRQRRVAEWPWVRGGVRVAVCVGLGGSVASGGVRSRLGRGADAVRWRRVEVASVSQWRW